MLSGMSKTAEPGVNSQVAIEIAENYVRVGQEVRTRYARHVIRGYVFNGADVARAGEWHADPLTPAQIAAHDQLVAEWERVRRLPEWRRKIARWLLHMEDRVLGEWDDDQHPSNLSLRRVVEAHVVVACGRIGAIDHARLMLTEHRPQPGTVTVMDCVCL